MPPEEVPPEVRFLEDPVSGGAAVVVALLALAAAVWWASRGDRAARRPVLLAAAASASLLAALNLVSRVMGWWVGPVFEPRAFLVLMALTVLGGVPGWVLWLGGYRWLAARVRWPLVVYGVIVLAFIPIVIVADQWQMGRNQFQMAGGYQIWHDVLLGQAVMWFPVLLYEGVRRWLSPAQRRVTAGRTNG